MYEQFYNLRERPFNLVPDPDFLYLSPQHKLARAYLEYGIRQRLGFVVLTGEVGTGKTTLIKSLIRARETGQRLGVLYQTSMAAGDLLDTLLREFEVRGHYPNRTAKLAAFNQFLLSAYSRSENVVLLVDEAQNLGPEALEEIRLLSNLQTEKEPLLQVILVGQPGLRERLRHPSLRQLAQRVSVHYHLNPLNFQETKEYINYRLARAGGSGIFTESALEKLFHYSQGVPRRINAWCDLALVAGFAETRPEIDGEFIDTVVAAQGGSLEGQEDSATPIAAPSSLVEGARSSIAISDNGLEATVGELAGRLTRLEGMVLELTSQLAPVLTKLLSKQLLDHVQPEPDQPAAPPSLPDQPPNLDEQSPPPKKWWSRFLKT
jgi:general secretion pathway protein A